MATAKGATTVPDMTGDQIPELAVLLDGSLFARVKDTVNGNVLGMPEFDPDFAPVALLSVDDSGGGAGPDVAVVGVEIATGNVQAEVRDVASNSLVRKISFSNAYAPFDAVVVANVGGGSSAREIAVLGINANGRVRAQIKDSLTGNQIRTIFFNKAFTPLAFAALPNAAGKLKYLAVLGSNQFGVIQVQIKHAGNGALVNNIKFSKTYEPTSLVSFADSNGTGGGEVGVVGVNGAGKVRAQVKEIDDGAAVSVFNFSSNFPPHAAIAVNGVAGTGRNEIAVLGENPAGQLRLQIKDLLTGDGVNSILVP
jgi:hypothetical protein